MLNHLKYIRLKNILPNIRVSILQISFTNNLWTLSNHETIIGRQKPVPAETMGQAKACTHGNHGSSFSLVPTSKHKSLYVIKEIIFNNSILKTMIVGKTRASNFLYH